MSQSVALFDTTSAALRAEKLLTGKGLPFKLIPTPRQISSDCGIALRFETQDRERVEALLREGSLEIAAIHELIF